MDDAETLLNEFNATTVDYPRDRRVLDYIAEHAVARPNDVAIVCGDVRVTYTTLASRVRCLAWRLRQDHGVGPDALVPLLMERSVDMVIGMLAIVEAGGAFLPLDPLAPLSRIHFMLADSRATILLTNIDVSPCVAQALTVLDLRCNESESSHDAPLPSTCAHTALMYCMYTSGSTGAPKGVLVEHSSVLNVLLWARDYLKINIDDRVLFKTTYTFDISVAEVFLPLLAGACLVVLPPGAEHTPSLIRDAVQRTNTTVVQFVPSALSSYLAALDGDALPGVTRCICVGEALHPGLRDAFYRATRNCDLFNFYGPTEATIYATAGRVSRRGPITIGRPLSNTRIRILNAQDRLCQIGVQGELCISGVPVARGYLNRPDQTSARFCNDPYDPDVRMYRTGDLAYWGNDGELQLQGRRDHQVKIRGHRIELGEVEGALTQIDGVSAAAVSPFVLGGRQELVAYWVGDRHMTANALRGHLRRCLPHYMIPARFVRLEELPVTANGKLRRSALPTPGPTSDSDEAYVAPADPLEQGLCAILEEVLAVRRVGMHDRFLDLGGDSLKALTVAMLVRRRLSCDLQVAALLKNTILADIALRPEVSCGAAASAPDTAASSERYPLSPGQYGLWMLEQSGAPPAVYNVVGAYDIDGPLDVDALRHAFEALIERHESLRTAVYEVDDVPMQSVSARVALDWHFDASPCEGAITGERRVAEFVAQAFDLSSGCLMRVLLLRRAANAHVLAVSLHHIVSDGWSLSVLANEVLSIYCALVDGRRPPHSAMRRQYRDYIHWHNCLAQCGSFDDSQKFWAQLLRPLPERLALPHDRPRPLSSSFRGAEQHRTVAAGASVAFTTLCRAEHVTLFAGLCTVLRILLFRYTAQEDVLIGTTVLGRSAPDLRDQIGCYVNIVPIRARVTPTCSFRDVLRSTYTFLIESLPHWEYPFEHILTDLRSDAGAEPTPLFDIMALMDPGWGDPLVSVPGVTIRRVDIPKQHSKVDLTVTFKETDAGIRMSVEYSTDLFDSDRIDRMLGHLETLLTAATADPDARVQTLQLLPVEERHQVLYSFNDTAVKYHDDGLAHELFEHQARRVPESVAAVDGSRELTFEQLNARANALAWILRTEHAVRADTLVGLMLERSVDVIVGILGILKAGGAYLPLSPRDPIERVGSLLTDSGATVVLSQGPAAQLLRRRGYAVIDPCAASLSPGRSDNPPRLGGPRSLAYCIYTSGSTGTPKGALIEHRSLVNRLTWMCADLELDEHDVFLQKTPYVFDVSVWELLLPGMLGARQVFLRPGGEIDPETIRDSIVAHSVSIVHFVPSMLAQYLSAFEDGLRDVKRCVCSGEELSPGVARHVLAPTNGGVRLYNYYGPTEATVDVSSRLIVDADAEITIGRPAANNRFYILDACGEPCPIGVTGELYIGGVQVGRGYVNCPSLTREHFVPDPFHPGERMYRTGDMARWRSDGEVLYRGRRDRQVKISGIRVELGEIEHVISSHSDVDRAVVTVQRSESGAEYLCAYLHGHVPVAPEQMRAYLSARLPRYMIPSRFVQAASLPVTRNGKLDISALVALGPYQAGPEKHDGPRTSAEEDIVTLWRAVLPVAQFGINDDFFAVGGTSLSALQLSSRLSRRFKTRISVASIFSHRTVAMQACLVASTLTSSVQTFHAAHTRALTALHPLSFAQERMWFLYMLAPLSAAYNLGTCARLRGNIDTDALRRAVFSLWDRHDMLRVTFVDDGEQVCQTLRKQCPCNMDMHDLTALAVDDARDMARRMARAAGSRPFRLQEEPPFRALICRVSADEHYIAFVLHHIAGDGWSLEVLMRDLSALYAWHRRRGRIAPLPALSLQYADYVRAVRQPDHRNEINQGMEYWASRLAGYSPLTLPTDSVDAGIHQSGPSGRESVIVPPDVCRKLSEVSQQNTATLFDIVMAALNLVLSRLSGQDDVVVGFPVTNRNDVELEGIVGLFLNTLVLRTDLSGRPAFGELLQRVSTGVRDALNHQSVPFELLVERLNPTRRSDQTPIINVLLNFLDGARETTSIDGVSVEFEDLDETEAKFPLEFYVQRTAHGLKVDLVYRSALFSARRMEVMARQLTHVLEQIGEAPDKIVAAYSLVPPGSLALPDLSLPLSEPVYPSVPELIAERARVVPDHVAIIQSRYSVTYRELVQRSDAIASGLIARGIRPGDVVAVAGRRGIGFVAGLLGALRSGAVAFPLDELLPEGRRQRLLAAAKPRIFIYSSTTGEASGDQLAPQIAGGSPVLAISHAEGRISGPETYGDPATLDISEEAPAYLFFTSGTTGEPRGVIGRHGSLSHFLVWQSHTFAIGQHDRCAQLTRPSFDVMLRDTFLALVSGGVLIIPEAPDELCGTGMALFSWLEREHITVLHTVPTLLQSWLSDISGELHLPRLRWTFLAGEPLKSSVVEEYRARCPHDGEIVNLYGPTETTLAKCHYLVPRGPLPPVIPVGAPLPHCNILVMNGDVHCGVGEPGDIIIRTPFRSCGYLNSPGTLGDGFYMNPYRDDSRDLLFLTGDIGRVRPDGTLEVLGRTDHQVKIDGVRVHPAEVEEVLCKHPSVRACVVATHEDLQGDIRLVAYVVSCDGGGYGARDLRAYLSALLPLPMVPRDYVYIERVPTTPNGKPDRQALPTPVFNADGDPAPQEAPRTETEHRVHDAWSAVLGRPHVGLSDNFFEIGGTSLRLLRLYALLNKHFPGRLRVAQLFSNPTIASQAAAVDPTSQNSRREERTLDF